jgi:LAO/AO transport system kinase
MDIVRRIRSGDRSAVAKAISVLERGGAEASAIISAIQPFTGRAWRIGITGPPGAGKSTLLARLARMMQRNDAAAGVVAVDPSSPFTGGAVLGDRVRMANLDDGGGIFIRSMATRGRSGGLSARTGDAADVLDAAGFDPVFIESAGVGQVELDIRDLADTTIVVLVPESGDQVQAIKAGIMEIGDLYVINKSDRPGCETLRGAVQATLRLQERRSGWKAPVLAATATDGTGVVEIAGAIHRHRAWLDSSESAADRRRRRLHARVQAYVEEVLVSGLWSASRLEMVDDSLEQISEGDRSMDDLADSIIADYRRDSR